MAEAVAELTSDPLSMSAWVVTYCAEQVTAAPGGRVVAGQVTAGATDVAGEVKESVTVMAVTVTFPVLRTTKV